MAVDRHRAGYWLAAADGGIFAFGDAEFLGAEANRDRPVDVTGIAASPDGQGYWLSTIDGKVIPFGVPDLGSAAETSQYWGSAPTIAIAAGTRDGYVLLHGDPNIFAIQDQGPAVADLQQRLTDLGFWLGAVDGAFGPLTEQAVVAFQKWSGLEPHGRIDEATSAALATSTRPTTTRTEDGIDVDKTTQLLYVVHGGSVVWTFNTSTGTEQPYVFQGVDYVADTPPGDFVVQRQVDGWRVAPLGRLYRPKFINGGIAIHGYSDVPAEPASHGCIRLTNPAMDFLWADGVAPLGSRVWVRGTSPAP